MGLPQIKIAFETLAVSAINRSQNGIVALILKDAKAGSYEFKSLDEVNKEDFSDVNYDFIKLAFRGTPNKVVVEVILSNSDSYTSGLTNLVNKKWNYLAIPQIEQGECEVIKSWIVDQRRNGKMRKAILPKFIADHEAIINFATEEIKVGDKVYTSAEYCARIAGIVAGLPFTRSSTYFVLDEVESIKEHSNPDEDIDAGKLILINDGRKIKIGRGVNSLTSTTVKKSIEFKKIKLMECMDLIYEDIRNTFEDEYVGKVNNHYDNKCLFVTAVNAYFKTLQKDDILDPNNDAYIEVDTEANRLYLESRGIDTDKMSEAQVKAANTGSIVLLKGKVKPLDAMEDLDLIINI